MLNFLFVKSSALFFDSLEFAGRLCRKLNGLLGFTFGFDVRGGGLALDLFSGSVLSLLLESVVLIVSLNLVVECL